MNNSGRLVLVCSSFALLMALFVYCVGLASKAFRETSEDVSWPADGVGPGTPSPTPLPIVGAQFYVSPNGLPTGNGSITRPWDFATAIHLPNVVKPGATIYLRGGTYSGKFTSTLTGTQASPITVRSYPGEWAKIDGFRTTTLTSSITAVESQFLPVTDTSGFSDPNQVTELVLDNEVIRTLGSSGNNLLIYGRGSSGGGPPAAHSAGATVSLAGRQLLVTGANTIYQGFEVMSSDPARDAVVFPARGWGRGDGVVNAGSGNKFINLVVHDNLDGIVTSGASANTEVYGNVVYNNGLISAGEGLGHGMYLENGSGYSRIYSNLVFNSFNLGMQAYGVTAPYSGGDLQDNVYANSGAPLGTRTRNRNAVIGPESQRIPSISILRNHFYHQSNTNSYGVILGYGAGISSGTFNNNYIVGGGTQLEIQNTSSLTGQGNQIYSSTPDVGGYLKINGTNDAFSWNNNTYHNAGTRTLFANNGNLHNFTSWKAATGFDSGGTATAVAMPNQVIVIPNSYEPGRANVIIYNTTGASTVQINLSQAGLTNGQTYEIRDAENYFGPLVRTGTYNSTSPTVSIPMTGLTVAPPMGLPKRSHTAPEFGIFVVIKTSPSPLP